MKTNTVKERIAAGQSVLGTFVKFTDPAAVEILALAGFDFFVLDTEHVAVDREQLMGILRAADAAGITPLVRVRENQQVEILQNLDLGYAGVQVPNVDTPEEARALVRSVKYGPLGVRGFSPSVRACGYGATPIDEYIEAANRNTLVVAHCESQTCVENLDTILRVEGLDVIFIGPMDLSQSLGMTGKTADPAVKTVVDGVIEAVKAGGRAVGTVAGSAEAARALMARGVQYILLSSDQGMLMNAAKTAVRAIREGGA